MGVKKHLYRVLVVVLVMVLAVVTFYMLFVHVPHYQYYHQLDEVRNEICEKNNYEYMGYFNEHRGKNVYYVIKVKIDGVLTYVAYDEDKKLVDSYQGEVVNERVVKQAILKKYEKTVTSDDLETLDIGYENDQFVYYVKVQREESLLYLYYSIEDGSFIKAYKLASGI
jgi:uncharacterized protein YpmB